MLVPSLLGKVVAVVVSHHFTITPSSSYALSTSVSPLTVVNATKTPKKDSNVTSKQAMGKNMEKGRVMMMMMGKDRDSGDYEAKVSKSKSKNRE